MRRTRPRPTPARGVTVLNQSVLLAGVNDELDVLFALSERLFEAGALPITSTSSTPSPARRTSMSIPMAEVEVGVAYESNIGTVFEVLQGVGQRAHAELPEVLAPKSVLQIAALPGTTIVRVAHQTSNAHQAWGLANMGKVTDPGSLFARYGITAQFRRLEKADDRIAALRAMAAAIDESEESSAEDPSVPGKEAGVHLFTIRGDESAWLISRTNQELQQVNPAFAAEIIGLSGLSAGEDTFLGLAEWKAEPQKALGGVVVAVPHDGAWSVPVFWCAENNVPFNADQNYYDPHALNVVETKNLDGAAELYVNKETVERIFLTDGENPRNCGNVISAWNSWSRSLRIFRKRPKSALMRSVTFCRVS